MRRIAGALFLVASAICAVGGTLGSVHSEWLFGPALVLAGMGL
jgi:hypothetical protein